MSNTELTPNESEPKKYENIYNLCEAYHGGHSSYTSEYITKNQIHPVEKCISCYYYSPWKNGEVSGAYTKGQKFTCKQYNLHLIHRKRREGKDLAMAFVLHEKQHYYLVKDFPDVILKDYALDAFYFKGGSLHPRTYKGQEILGDILKKKDCINYLHREDFEKIKADQKLLRKKPEPMTLIPDFHELYKANKPGIFFITIDWDQAIENDETRPQYSCYKMTGRLPLYNLQYEISNYHMRVLKAGLQFLILNNPITKPDWEQFGGVILYCHPQLFDIIGYQKIKSKKNYEYEILGYSYKHRIFRWRSLDIEPFKLGDRLIQDSQLSIVLDLNGTFRVKSKITSESLMLIASDLKVNYRIFGNSWRCPVCNQFVQKKQGATRVQEGKMFVHVHGKCMKNWDWYNKDVEGIFPIFL